MVFEFADEDIEEFFTLRIRGGIGEAWAVGLLGVAVDGEVADSEDVVGFVFEVLKAKVQFAFVIVEDSEFGDLFRELLRFLFRVGSVDSDEEHQSATAPTNFPSVDLNGCGGDSLDDGSHFELAVSSLQIATKNLDSLANWRIGHTLVRVSNPDDSRASSAAAHYSS